MPAKRKGSEIREVTSIRLEPADKEMIIKIFGSMQLWIDHCLEVFKQTKGSDLCKKEKK